MRASHRADALLQDLRKSGRGRLKVFLGAAPGVGKTYAMLQAAHTQLKQGVKVRVGVVETHGRADTEAMLLGLPAQALLKQEYRGIQLSAMDLDGILRDPPQLLLVDELAHSNAPSSRHSKRWQDVQELLDAGIDIYTTVNVQHLEALNDKVREITGVQVRETLPDWVLHEADDILLIDLPPRELLERLREGKVYVPEQARAAIDAFFSQTNLTALRELAMQTAAARVDADLRQRYLQQGQALPVVRGRLLLAIDGDAQAERLVRHAYRVAERRHLPWSVVHVDSAAQRDETRLAHLQNAQQLAERLGAEVVTLRGGEVSQTFLEHARQRQASLLMVGRGRPLWRRRLGLGRSLAERLLQQGAGFEVSVMDGASEQPLLAQRRPAGLLRWADYLLAVVATLIAAAVASVLASVLELPNISLVLLAAVLVVAVRSSLGPALVCAGLSFLAYNFMFISPTLTLSIARQEDVLTLMFFLLMAALTGNLASRQRSQLQTLRESQAETSVVLELSRKLTAATDRPAVLAAALQQLSRWPELQVGLWSKDSAQQWQLAAGSAAQPLSEIERAAADWSWRHGQPAGLGTGTLPGGRCWWLPLLSDEAPLALLAVSGDLPAERRRLLTALGQPIAQALQRAQLAEDLEAARLHGQTEELRSALLASVSHDLRTPLTVMRGSIDSLLALGETLSLNDRLELLEGTRDEAERLDRYIQNLLDMTRLGHGGLKLERDWVAPADILASALQRLRPVLTPLQVALQIPAQLPLLYVHAALIEQALVNVLDNAARFSVAQGRLGVHIDSDERELRFSVFDQGPGIPEAERDKIFDMFYTAARGDRGGHGTGLGLAICQGMLGAHGGHASVIEGENGQGTCMILHLPLHAQPAMDEDT